MEDERGQDVAEQAVYQVGDAVWPCGRVLGPGDGLQHKTQRGSQRFGGNPFREGGQVLVDGCRWWVRLVPNGFPEGPKEVSHGFGFSNHVLTVDNVG